MAELGEADWVLAGVLAPRDGVDDGASTVVGAAVGAPSCAPSSCARPAGAAGGEVAAYL